MEEWERKATWGLHFKDWWNQGGPRELKLAAVEVHGSPTLTFIDSGAIMDVMSMGLSDKMNLEPQSAKPWITMVDYEEAYVVGKVSWVPFTRGPVTKELSCLVAHTEPPDMIVNRVSMKICEGLWTLTRTCNFLFSRRSNVHTIVPLVTASRQDGTLLSGELTSDDYCRDKDNGTKDKLRKWMEMKSVKR